MASVHTTVTVQDFNGLEHGMVGARFFCAYTQEGEGLVERHAGLFEAKTYSPGGRVLTWCTCMCPQLVYASSTGVVKTRIIVIRSVDY